MTARRSLPALLAAILAAAPALAAADRGFRLLEGHGGPVRDVAVSEDGTRALTAGFDYSVGLWDLESGALIRWLEGHDAAVNAVAFVGADRAVSAGDDFALILWDLDAGAMLRRFEGHRGKLAAVRVSPDRRVLASAGWDGRVGLWELATGRLIRWLRTGGANVNDLAFSADGAALYTADQGGEVRRWPLAGDAPPTALVRHGFGVNRLLIDERAGWLAYGALDGATRIVDLGTGAPIADASLDRRPILALALSPDRRLLAVGDGQGYIMVLETAGWGVRYDFRAATAGPVWALAFSGDGGSILAGGLDDVVALWPIDGGPGPVLAAARPAGGEDVSAGNGERQFVRRCSICHTLTGDGARRAGPSLAGLFGRRAGGVPGYSYSRALATSDIVWTEATIDALFLNGPDKYTPGTKMPLQRITAADDRRALVGYLRRATAAD